MSTGRLILAGVMMLAAFASGALTSRAAGLRSRVLASHQSRRVQMAAGSGERPPFIIGIGGGSASGKTTVVESIMAKMGSGGRVVAISQDCFYRGLTAEQKASVADYNFDHPSAMDFDEQVELLRALQQGKSDVRVPQYDFCTHARLPSSQDTPVVSPDIVIFEGILALHDPRLRDMYDLSIFVDTDMDLRLLRRIQRDMEHRGRSLAMVIEQYERFVKPSHEQFVEPCKRDADIVVPFNRRNFVAVDLICDHIDLLRARCAQLAAELAEAARALQTSPVAVRPLVRQAPPQLATNGRVLHTNGANVHCRMRSTGYVAMT
jgi:uridine kinase